MTRRQHHIGLALCVVTILLAVIDTNIVSAATVPIVRDLDPAHGVDRIPWLIAAYQLAATAALPLYGRLSDVFGPKRVFVAALTAFLTGSALCGLAPSMGALIAARALQGLGGGGLMGVTMVLLRTLRGPSARSGSRSSGVGGVIAGAGMALGPWLGGLLADHADWRWIFYVNLPVGIAVLVAAVTVIRMPARPAAALASLDFLGAALAAAFSTTLLLVTEWGGKEYAWSSPTAVVLIGTAVVALGLFLWRQATAAEPVLPLGLFRIRPVRYGFAVQGLVGLAMMGSIVYVLVYLQVVRHLSSSAAGLHLIPMAAGMTAVGLLSGRLVETGWSQKRFVTGGTVCAAGALAWLASLSTDTSLWTVRAALLLMGIGFGQLVGQLIQLVQDSVPADRIGVATTGVRFFQTAGSALGAAVLGTVLSRVYAARGPGGTTSAIGALTGEARRQAVEAFTTSVDVVFWAATGVMVLAALLAARLPEPHPAPHPAEHPAKSATAPVRETA
ncbi:MFS transporter [Streptomyces sp. NPDC001493]